MFNAVRSALARYIEPKGSNVRRFDAAAVGRRTSGYGTIHRVASEVSGAATTVRARARYLAANNPHICNAIENWTCALVGSGIVPTGERGQVSRFNAWAEFADHEGRTDFAGLQAAVARAMVIDGEAFVRHVGNRLQIIPAEMVDESLTSELSDGRYVVNGVEFAVSGERVAYWVLPSRPTDQFASYATPVRVPASEMLHIFKPIGAGQVRGMSWLAPIIVPAGEFDAIVDALAVGVKVAALHAGFIVDATGNATSVPFEGDQIGTALEGGLEPGTLRVLPAGFDIKFSSPQQANETAAFLRFELQMLAAGLGLPEHMLSGDLSQANYSRPC